MILVVRLGASGAKVLELQRLLNRHVYPVIVDGVFGPKVENQVVDFQAIHGLKPDGIVGRKTWHALKTFI
jgi:peptidoglycan hydrolase-like protein with peptidoglycan-binding domain